VRVGFYDDEVLPRAINVMLGNRECAKLRARAVAGLEGEVLEVGFGSGLNVPLYPAEVTKVLAVDPATVGRKLAADRVAASPIPVEYVGLDGEALPLPDESVDHALSTWTLCTIPDVHRALLEIRRVLRPGGTLHFLEHGLCPEPKVAKWQHRLTPLQRRIAGGCHFNRDIDALLVDADFTITREDHFSMRGPKTMGYMYEGVAARG
jgi:ubiquinone/menaquinone biosynthesis C-methylase UbiE